MKVNWWGVLGMVLIIISACIMIKVIILLLV